MLLFDKNKSEKIHTGGFMFGHFTWDDRIRLETMIKDGVSVKEIAIRLKKHISSIYREIKRGQIKQKQTDYTFKTIYAADVADRYYRENLKEKGPNIKIGKDHKLAKYLEKIIIKHKYSPKAALMNIKRKGLKFTTNICATTLYSYIDKGIFLEITNKHLPIKSQRKNKYNKLRRRARSIRGESIENRPAYINQREDFGHWECDTVIGKRETNKVLMVLTERLTRQEIIMPLREKTSKFIVRAINKLEKRYGHRIFKNMFKSITCDNGGEFADWQGIEKSIINPKKKRTTFYSCHPYSSWERGSNENQNKLIRRFIPKGTPIENYSVKEIENIERWINEYPREIFGGRASSDLFNEEMDKLIEVIE